MKKQNMQSVKQSKLIFAPFSSGFRELVKNRILYLMMVPGIAFLFLFCYLPMAGSIIVFKEFRFDLGIFNSPWITPIYKNFIFFFTTGYAWRVTRNTILLNIMFIAIGTVFEVGLALLFNEIRNKYFKKVAQTLTFLPNFVSWIIVMVFVYNIFNSDRGVLNSVLNSLGLAKVDWYFHPNLWPFILLLFNRWKYTGFGAIIYLSALSSIDTALYEAATVDGASRLQKIKCITIPLLMPTVTVLTLLAIGRIMNADFGMFYAVVGDSPQLYPSVDVIDTFIFRSLRKIGDIGMSSAAGFYQSCLAFVLILICNGFARKYQREGAIF
jgi:putative aldouronate transport system permease protein